MRAIGDLLCALLVWERACGIRGGWPHQPPRLRRGNVKRYFVFLEIEVIYVAGTLEIIP